MVKLVSRALQETSALFFPPPAKGHFKPFSKVFRKFNVTDRSGFPFHGFLNSLKKSVFNLNFLI